MGRGDARRTRPLDVIGDSVQIELSRNGGSAFGRFQGMTHAARGRRDRRHRSSSSAKRATRPIGCALIGFTLVLGGALGNLCDRFFRAPGFLRGHVVDFVAVGRFPVFNVADSCITIGAIILVCGHVARTRAEA